MSNSSLIETTEIIRSEAGFKILQKADSNIVKILYRATFVSAYALNHLNEWARADVEGALYIVERSIYPRFRLIILNQLNPHNLVENITASWELSSQRQFIFFRLPSNSNKEILRIAGLWFSNEQERKMIKKGIDDILRTQQTKEILQSNSNNALYNLNKYISSYGNMSKELLLKSSTIYISKNYCDVLGSGFKEKNGLAESQKIVESAKSKIPKVKLQKHTVIKSNLLSLINSSSRSITYPSKKFQRLKLLIDPNINRPSGNHLKSFDNTKNPISIQHIVSNPNKTKSLLSKSSTSTYNEIMKTNIPDRKPEQFLKKHLERLQIKESTCELDTSTFSVNELMSSNLYTAARNFYDTLLESMKRSEIRESIISDVLSNISAQINFKAFL